MEDTNAKKVMDSDSDAEILDASDPDYHAKEIARKFKERCKKFKNTNG